MAEFLGIEGMRFTVLPPTRRSTSPEEMEKALMESPTVGAPTLMELPVGICPIPMRRAINGPVQTLVLPDDLNAAAWV